LFFLFFCFFVFFVFLGADNLHLDADRDLDGDLDNNAQVVLLVAGHVLGPALAAVAAELHLEKVRNQRVLEDCLLDKEHLLARLQLGQVAIRVEDDIGCHRRLSVLGVPALAAGRRHNAALALDLGLVVGLLGVAHEVEAVVVVEDHELAVILPVLIVAASVLAGVLHERNLVGVALNAHITERNHARRLENRHDLLLLEGVGDGVLLIVLAHDVGDEELPLRVGVPLMVGGQPAPLIVLR